MKKTAITLIIIAHTIIVWAVPAKRTIYNYTQPDGTIVLVMNQGDEFFHFTSTEDGIILFPDNNGFLRYAILNNSEELAPGKYIAKNLSQRSNEEKEYIASLNPTGINNAIKQKRRNSPLKVNRQKALSKASSVQNPEIVKGKIKGLIILVNFSDVQFSNTREEVDKLMNEEGYVNNNATGSARDYFIAQSSGAYTPEFNVVGPVTMEMPMKYYGQNKGYGGYDLNPEEMVFTAVEKAYNEGLIQNLDDYDKDGDGVLDMVYIIYAGYGEADKPSMPNTIWPHMSNLRYYGSKYLYKKVGDKYVDLYACSSERRGDGTFSGIGTFCHEYGHCLGLPDMYDVDYSGGYGMSGYSIMGSGSYLNNGNTPPNYNSYERYSLGWLEFEVLDSPQRVSSLIEIGSSNKAYKLTTNNSNEYFTLENRQIKGWDKYLYGNGMMILHIDFDQTVWDNNGVNDDPNHQRVRLMAADNSWGTQYIDLMKDLYPGLRNNTSFTDNSKPNSLTWDKQPLNKPITNIQMQGEVISFDFMENFTGISNEADKIKIAIDHNKVIIISTFANEEISIYKIDGQLVEKRESVEGENEFILSSKQVYIIRTGSEVRKVITY